MNKKKYITIVLVALLICVAAFGGIMAARMMVTPFEVGQHGAALRPVQDGKINFLVVGTDKVASNTDTILVATINTNKNTISIMSVPRDTKVQIKNKTMKINAVYSYAQNSGMNDEEVLIDTVSEVTGIGINYYAIINTEAFRDIVDKLGGVRYNVPRDYDYDDPYQDLHIHLKKGDQVLNGENAEGLVRYRYDYARADLERVEVQQDFIKEMIKQKLRLEYIPKIPSVYKTISKNVISNLKVDDVIDFGKKVVGIDEGAIQTFTLPGEPKMIGGASYVIVDKEATKALVDENF